MTYLFIFEDGTINASDAITDDDRELCDDGVLDVVRVAGDPPNVGFEAYYEGEWHEVKSLKESS